jgi:hypothetical protein
MPQPLTLSRIAAALVLAIAVAACGDSSDGVTAPPSAQPGATTTAPPATEQPDTQSCAAPERGYRLEFPKRWYTNDAGIAEPCRFFHPEPFTLAPRTEATGIAINVRLNPVGFREVAPDPEGSSSSEVLGHRTTTVDGRAAVRAETRTTGQGLLPSGTRVTGWFVDAGDGTLVATTSEAAAAGRYDDNVNVLDAMMRSLRLSDRKSACSTGRSVPPPARQPELPAAVSDTRMAIIEAARACDYDRLAEVALAGDSRFTYSFGGSGRPAAFWREAEAAGRAPLRMLVELLDGPAATRDAGGTTQYVWPAAYAFETWSEVPPSAREELRRIYGEDDLRRFEQFGSYVGHRVGITESGDWIFFVAGD